MVGSLPSLGRMTPSDFPANANQSPKRTCFLWTGISPYGPADCQTIVQVLDAERCRGGASSNQRFLNTMKKKHTHMASTATPGLYCLVIDSSGSMGSASAADPSRKKIDFCQQAGNEVIQGLVEACSVGEEIRDRLYVGVVRLAEHIDSVLALPNPPFHPISEVDKLTSDPARKPYFQLRANTATPMGETLTLLENPLADFVSNNPDSPAPTLILVTDGEPTGKDPLEPANRLKAIETKDGNTVLMVIHIASHLAPRILFPSELSELQGDSSAELLFKMSSPMPECMVALAREFGYPCKEGARALIVNGTAADLAKFFQIGSTYTTGAPAGLLTD